MLQQPTYMPFDAAKAKHVLRKVPAAAWAGIAVIVLVLLVAGLARAATPSANTLSGKAFLAAQELLTSAKRLAKQATQDVDSRQRARDIDTGLAFICAARFLASDAVLERRCGVKVDELFATLRALDEVPLP